MKGRAKRLGLILLALSAGLGAQVIGGGGSGNATSLQGKPVAATAPSNGNCLVFTTQWGPGSCSGTASTNWSSLVSGTNTTGAFLIGTGASLGATGSGTIAATSVPASGVSGNLTLSQLPALPWVCSAGMGDGLNAIPAGTYLQTTCYNGTGQTVTITGILCYADAGSSTMNVTNGAGTGLLTGAVTCTSSFAAGTQSSTVTIAPGDYAKFTFVADGTSKQSSWVIKGTY